MNKLLSLMKKSISVDSYDSLLIKKKWIMTNPKWRLGGDVLHNLGIVLLSSTYTGKNKDWGKLRFLY